MKIYSVALMALVVLSLPSLAGAGGNEGGGGGKAVVCRDASGNIVHASSYDLYEGTVRYGYKTLANTASMMDQVQLAVGHIGAGRSADHFPQNLVSWAAWVSRSMRLLPDGSQLFPVNDGDEVIAPEGCNLEQLANFTTDNEVLVNGDIWSALGSTDQAALIVHEAVYKILRNLGATNSVLARESVAFAFAGFDTQGIYTEVPRPHLTCQTLRHEDGSLYPGSRFQVYNTTDGAMIFQFGQIEGDYVLSKATFTFNKAMPLSQFATIPTGVTWHSINSKIGWGRQIGLSFTDEVLNGVTSRVMKIGLGSMPTAPTSVYTCVQVN